MFYVPCSLIGKNEGFGGGISIPMLGLLKMDFLNVSVYVSISNWILLYSEVMAKTAKLLG